MSNRFNTIFSEILNELRGRQRDSATHTNCHFMSRKGGESEKERQSLNFNRHIDSIFTLIKASPQMSPYCHVCRVVAILFFLWKYFANSVSN